MPEAKIGKVYKPNILKGMITILVFMPFIFFFIFPLFLFGTLPFTLGLTQIVLFLIALAIIVLPPLIMYLSLSVQSYELRSDGVFVKKGIISKSQALVLYSQVQDVNESQGILENILGVGNLSIITMAQKLPVMLVYLNKSEMDEIRDFVLKMTSMSSKKAKAKSVEISEVKESASGKPLYNIYPIKKNLVAMTICMIVVILFIALFSPFLGTSFLLVEFLFIIIFAFIFFAVLITSVIGQISFRLKISERSLVIGSEFLARNFINLPFDKVQDLGFNRGVFDRLLHMASIKIETGEAFIPTAGKKSSIPLNSISNLYEKDAIELRKIVLTRSGIKNLKTDALRDNFPLQKIKILKKSVSTTFWLFISLAILTVIINPLVPFLGGILISLLPIVPIVIFFIKLVYETFYFRSYYYADNREILILRKGVFTIKEVIVPYEKIQNIFVNRDIFDRIFGLYDVHLSTVGFISQMELHIDGVSKKDSEGLKVLFSHRVPS